MTDIKKKTIKDNVTNEGREVPKEGRLYPRFVKLMTSGAVEFSTVDVMNAGSALLEDVFANIGEATDLEKDMLAATIYGRLAWLFNDENIDMDRITRAHTYANASTKVVKLIDAALMGDDFDVEALKAAYSSRPEFDAVAFNTFASCYEWGKKARLITIEIDGVKYVVKDVKLEVGEGEA